MARFETLREVARLYIRQQRRAVALCERTSLTQCWIVTELGRNEKMTLGELAQLIGLDKSWVSRAVDALVAGGLLAKSADAGDGRRVFLTLTKRGQARFSVVNDALDAHARAVLQHIPAKERMAVQRAMSLLHEALRQHSDAGEERCAV